MASPSSKNLQILDMNVPLIATSFVISVLSITLNSIEIYLIRKSWRRVTHFEIILMNLAVADTFSGIGNLACTSVATYFYITKSGITLLGILFNFLSFSISSSCFFVIMIAAERLKAIRKPFEQRARSWGEQGMFCCLTKLWATIIACTLITSLVDWFVFRKSGKKHLVSGKVAYALAAFLIVVSLVAVVFYTWIAVLIFKKRAKLDTLYSSEPNGQKLREARRQDLSVIFVCFLIKVTFMVCHLPFAINLLNLEMRKVESILVTLNSVFDPLIYFFKGYMDRRSKVTNRSTFSADAYKENIKTAVRNNTEQITDDTAI